MTKPPRAVPDARRVAPTQGVARSPLQRRLQHHQHGHVHVLHADDRSGDRHAGGGVQVRLCKAGFDGLSKLHRVLKKAGTCYYLCDWHASHYVKVMLDKMKLDERKASITEQFPVFPLPINRR
jgi:hypothetical protein